MVHTFNPSAPEAEAGGNLRMFLAYMRSWIQFPVLERNKQEPDEVHTHNPNPPHADAGLQV